MLRRILITCLAVATALAALSPALAGTQGAKAKIIAQSTSPKGTGAVYLATGFVPGHRYRIDLVSPAHVSFTGAGLENYAYVYKGRLGTGTHNFKFSGKAPRSMILKQPVSFALDSWQVTVEVSDTARKQITLRFVDLGTHK